MKNLTPNNAFEKYLTQLHPIKAAEHVYDCLHSSRDGNAAWQLMDRYYGPKWSFKPHEMPEKLLLLVIELRKGASDDN